MLYRVLSGAALLLACGPSFAASVATVSSRGSVTVSGIQVPTERLISWPVSASDEIATAGSPAMIRFSDGSVLTLQKNSRVKLDASPSKFNLVSGAAILDGKPRTAVTRSANTATLAALGQTNSVAAVRYSNATTAAALPMPQTVALYRSPSSTQYYLAPSASMTGTFTMRDVSGGTFSAQIVLPSGLTLNVTPTGTPGVYTITSVTVPGVTETINGVTTTTVVTTNLPAGTTLTVTNPTSSTTSTNVTVAITLPGSTTPATGAQVATAIQTAVTTTVQTTNPGATVTVTTPSAAIVNTFSPAAP